jgi:hypothetical protein
MVAIFPELSFRPLLNSFYPEPPVFANPLPLDTQHLEEKP